MKMLFVGESWAGSSARSLKESLRRISSDSCVEIDEINEDLYMHKSRSRWLRGIHKILRPAYRKELADAITTRCKVVIPDVLIVYKGFGINPEVIRCVKSMGIFTVNVFPDYSPHAYGPRLRSAIGEYDLVISTKPFHPPLWKDIYGYTNTCMFVPHGYDHLIHLRESVPDNFQYDVGLVANWRPEYHALLREVAALLEDSCIKVAIAGNGWPSRAQEFPEHWVFPGEISGSAYPSWIRQSRIILAPVNRNVVINGVRQPGDEDTTRTYELAAAYCFFIHQRTNYVSSIYDELLEVPLFENAGDAVRLIHQFLADSDRRSKMAAAAHARAVPCYSIDKRAEKIIAIIRQRSGEFNNRENF